MRMLGVDYGDSRIGLAVCDETETLASPLGIIKAASMRKNIDAVADVARREGAECVVVGLPLNMDGSEGPRASKTRSFGKVLERVAGMPVAYFDERLTSVAAEEIMDLNGVKPARRKEISDSIAAQLILEGYMEYIKRNKEQR